MFARARSFAVALTVGLGVAGSADAACRLSKLAELPIELRRMQPLVTAKVNGEAVKLLADSGAFFSLIFDPAVARLKLVAHEIPFELRGVGGDTDTALTVVKAFTLGDATIPDVDFLVSVQGMERDIAGVLGQNVLKLADVEYDLGAGAIRLVQAKGCEQNDLAYWAEGKPYSVLDLAKGERGRRASVVNVVVNGVKLDALMDTGAASSLVGLQTAARLGLRPNGPGVTPAGYGSGLSGRRVQTWITPVGSVQIGDETIKDTKLRIGGDLPDGRIDMLLGADFFRSHRVYVANSQGRVFFTYNGSGPVFDLSKHPDEPAKATADTSGSR